MAKKRLETPPFETTLQELEALVTRLEHGNLSLEEALTHFERGVSLARTCQQALRAAEQKVQILLEQDGHATLQPFNVENLHDDIA